MNKFTFAFFIAILFAFNSYGQKDTLSKKDKAALDSMIKNDEFLKMMNESKGSKVNIAVGIGNGTFSDHNKAVNATGETKKLVITPSLFYHHKSGFSVGIMPYITSDSLNSAVYQTGLSASYDYSGDVVDAGVSYTRYLSDKSKYNNNSLYQNDIFGYVKKSGGIIQPLLQLGFSNGNYKEWGYTYFKRPIIGDTILIKDSTTNKASYFSVTVGIEHDFSEYNLFSKNDELEINPSILINSGSDNISSTHTNKAYNNIIVLNRRKKFVSASNKFQLQSVAASLDMTYSIGKFYVQPSLYADYYLPSTTSKRLTAIYSLTVGLSF